MQRALDWLMKRHPTVSFEDLMDSRHAPMPRVNGPQTLCSLASGASGKEPRASIRGGNGEIDTRIRVAASLLRFVDSRAMASAWVLRSRLRAPNGPSSRSGSSRPSPGSRIVPIAGTGPLLHAAHRCPSTELDRATPRHEAPHRRSIGVSVHFVLIVFVPPRVNPTGIRTCDVPPIRPHSGVAPASRPGGHGPAVSRAVALHAGGTQD